MTNSTTDAEGWSACPSCGAGTQTRTWKNNPNKPQIPPGLACLRGDGVTETRSCVSKPACITPAACQGSWGGYSACSISCGTGGTQYKSYTVTKDAVGTGGPCIDPDDNVTDLSANISKRNKTRPCNPAPPLCCTDVSKYVGEWTSTYSDCGTDNEYGQPVQIQSRDIIVGNAGGATQTDVARCGFSTTRTVITSRGCSNRGSAYVFRYSGGSWDGTKCTVNPSGGSCPPGLPYEYKGGGAAGGQACSYTKSCPEERKRNNENCTTCAC